MPMIPLIRQISLAIFLWLSTGVIAFSQAAKSVDIVESYNQTVAALGANDHAKALTLSNAVIAKYGDADKGKEAFGPVYGHWFYLRGLAFMGTEKWAEACADFETCYQCTDKTPAVLACQRCNGFGRYPAPAGKRAPDGKVRCSECGGIPYSENRMANMFRMHSLAHWGNSLMVLEDYGKAKKVYNKALSEDTENRLNFNWKLYIAVNLGRCLIKSGAVDEGYNYIIRALDAERFPLSIKQVVFQVLADDWSPQVSPEKTREFLEKYRHIPLSASPEERARRNPNFFYLANSAFKEQGDPLLALSWFRLVAHPAEAVAELETTIDLYQTRKESLEKEEMISLIDAEIEKKQKARDQIVSNFWSMQSGSGIAYFGLQNYAASFSIYRGLADHAPKDHDGRPEFLHNAVISAVKIDNWTGAYQYGRKFLDEYPEHPLRPSVVRVLVEMIFIQGDYQKAYDIAKEVRGDMETGSKDRDIPDFVVGASAFQLGKNDEAEAELTSYLANYSPAQRAELATYFLGSVKVRKFAWDEGAEVFNGFLKEYPESAVVSSVLYQNGLCHFMLDDNETALAFVDRVTSEFPDANEVPRALNLRGDIQTVEEADLDTEIKVSYENAISSSKNFADQSEIAAYATWQLLMNTSSEERWEESGQWFDQFQQNHEGSVYEVDMLIGSLDMLVALERTPEALQRLEEELYESSSAESGGSQLGELFGTYLDFIKENDPENAISRLDQIGSDANATEAFKAWTIIGKIQLLEDAEGDNEEEIQKLFYRLNNKFDPSKHSNYVIVRLARWHTETRKQPQDAAPLYDYILANREGSEDFDLALLDRAQIDAQSEVPEERARAKEYFERILNEFENPELAESAHVGVARLLMIDKKVEESLPLWEAYMDNTEWNKYSAEANYSYGSCLDQLGRTDEALVVFINTYNAFPGYLDFSTPAYLRSALIMKGKGEDLKALLILRDMLTRMQKTKHPNKDKALQLFTKWRAEYVPPKKEGGK